jgi:hypothetical protein
MPGQGEPQADEARDSGDAPQADHGWFERFRRQQVDDPVDERHRDDGGWFERFRRQQVDDPVEERRGRG